MLRVYSDSRPRNLEIADIQKGLVLLHGERELVEEGAGFGAPVVFYNGEPYFSSAADVSLSGLDHRIIINKHFAIDAVSRKQLWDGPFLDNSTYAIAHHAFMNHYTRTNTFKPVFSAVMQLLHACGLRTRFIKVRPKGTVAVKYVVNGDCVEIEADFTGMASGWEGALLLNEQGPAFFRRYRDSDGLVLTGDSIGGWGEIGAKEARIEDEEGTIFFGLRREKGSRLFLGREVVPGRFSWVGIAYHLQPTASFRYRLIIGWGKPEMESMRSCPHHGSETR